MSHIKWKLDRDYACLIIGAIEQLDGTVPTTESVFVKAALGVGNCMAIR